MEYIYIWNIIQQLKEMYQIYIRFDLNGFNLIKESK